MHQYKFAKDGNDLRRGGGAWYPKLLDASTEKNGSDLVAIPRISCPDCAKVFGLGDWLPEIKAGMPTEELAHLVRCGGIRDTRHYTEPSKRTYKTEDKMNARELALFNARIQIYSQRGLLKADSIKRSANDITVLLYPTYCKCEDQCKMVEWNSQRSVDVCGAQREQHQRDFLWVTARKASKQKLADFKIENDAALKAQQQEIFKGKKR